MQENRVWVCESVFGSDLRVWVMRLQPAVFKMCQCMSRCVLAWGCVRECWCWCLFTSATWSVVLCMLMSARMCVFCLRGGDDRSKSVCYSWVGATAVSVCLGPGLFADKRMLGDKWFSTCQSEQKDKRWKKRKGSAVGGGGSKWWRLSDQQGAKQLREEGNGKRVQ